MSSQLAIDPHTTSNSTSGNGYATRLQEVPQDVAGSDRTLRDDIGFISRRAIAAATGLPRETVRRMVLELEADGLILFGPRGEVANRGGMLQRPEVVAAFRILAHEVVQVASKLVALDILEPESARTR